MSYVLKDNQDLTKKLNASAWNWRAAAALLQSFDIVDEDDAERPNALLDDWYGLEVKPKEAHALGMRLKNYLQGLLPSARVRPDLSITSQADTGELIRDSLSENYSASYEWLSELAEFCINSEGFSVEQ